MKKILLLLLILVLSACSSNKTTCTYVQTKDDTTFTTQIVLKDQKGNIGKMNLIQRLDVSDQDQLDKFVEEIGEEMQAFVSDGFEVTTSNKDNKAEVNVSIDFDKVGYLKLVEFFTDRGGFMLSIEDDQFITDKAIELLESAGHTCK